MWSIVKSKVFIWTQFLFWNFLNFITVLIFSTGLCANGLLLFCIAPLIHWICKNFCFTQNRLDYPKMANNSNINDKIFIIKCWSAFLAGTSSFKSLFLYAYTNFCGLKHLKPDCFSCQLTKVNFWVPMKDMCHLSYKCRYYYNY
jgi:hypothetical protein